MVLMSAPFAGPPSVPFGAGRPEKGPDIHQALAALGRPRKHYQWYYSGREANADMWKCPQGVHDFLRAYYHHKSADWKANRPVPLGSWSAAELARMPTYYIMDFDKGMAETVAEEMPSPAEIAACRWLPEAELRLYSEEYARNGFQGGGGGTASPPTAASTPSWRSSPVAPSTCRPSSSPAPATGASTRSRAPSRRCGPAPAPACWAAT